MKFPQQTTTRVLFVMIMAAAMSLNAAAQGVAIDATSATSQNLKVVFDATDPERINAVYWNPTGLTGSEPNLTASGTYGSDPCASGGVEYFGNSWAPPDPPSPITTPMTGDAEDTSSLRCMENPEL